MHLGSGANTIKLLVFDSARRVEMSENSVTNERPKRHGRLLKDFYGISSPSIAGSGSANPAPARNESNVDPMDLSASSAHHDDLKRHLITSKYKL
jgi:hypothetical protein